MDSRKVRYYKLEGKLPVEVSQKEFLRSPNRYIWLTPINGFLVITLFVGVPFDGNFFQTFVLLNNWIEIDRVHYDTYEGAEFGHKEFCRNYLPLN